MSKDRQQANKLETYLERPEHYDGSLGPATEQIVDSLHHAAQHTQPRPGFLNELAQQLEEERMMQHHSPSRMSRGLRLLLGGVGLLAALAVIFYAVALFSEPDIEPSMSEMESPALIRRPENGPFAGQEIRLMQTLPESPDQLPQYRAQLQGLPSTIEEAKALAHSLGIVEPEVYQYANNAPHWIIMGRDGASLTLDPTQAEFAGFYYAQSMINALEGQTLPFDEASRIAQEVLGGAGLLPETFETVDLRNQAGPGLRTVRFVPLVDERPVLGYEAVLDAVVSPDGKLASVRMAPIAIEATGQSQIVKSAEDAFQELLEGTATYHYSFDHISAEEQVQIYRPQSEQFEDGEQITLSGVVTVLTSVESERVRAFLQSYGATSNIELTGARTSELASVYSGTGIEVTGIIHKPAGSELIQLELAEWNEPDSVTALSSCRIGILTRDGASGTLQTDDGTSLKLDNLPDELQAGQRAEVCGLVLDEAGTVVNWSFVRIPPVSGTQVGAGGGGAGGSASVSEQAVEVTRVVTEQAGNELTPAPTEMPQSNSSEVVTAPPMPIQNAGTRLEPGETVTLTGTIEGGVSQSGNQRQLQLGLLVEEGDPLQPGGQYYPLTGSSETLESLAESYRLHVQITGTVVENDEQLGRRQAILVTEFSRLWPDEQIEAFLGHIEMVELDGRDVALFTDDETGQPYVLPDGWLPPDSEQRVWMEGIVHPTQQVAGHPVLTPISQQSGSNVDNATSASDIPSQAQLPGSENTAPPRTVSGLQSTLVIERIVLGYSTGVNASAQGSSTETTLTPVWIFSGHTADGSQTFQIEVDATTGD
jgi:hypothetical protein